MINLTRLFEMYFANNRGPNGGPCDYGIHAVIENPLNNEIRLDFTFKCDREYCCGEPGCHFKPNWARLRSLAGKMGIQLGDPLIIRLHGVIEEGSLFTHEGRVEHPAKNERSEYDVIYREKDCD